MKFIKKIIILLIVLILLVILIVYMISKYNKMKNPEEYDTGPEQDISYNLTNQIQKVTNYQSYYTVNNIVKKYVTYVQELNGDQYIDTSRIQNKIEEEKAMQEEAYNGITNMLDEEYISNIGTTNIVNNLRKFTLYGDYNHSNLAYNLIINEMYIYELSTSTSLYMVYMDINNIQTKIMIKLDDEYKTFSIFLEDYMDKYNYSKDMQKEQIQISDKNIFSNNYNKFTYAIVSNETMAKEYLKTYKNLATTNTQKAYQYLDEDYKLKRFGNYEKYKTYIDENKTQISKIELSSYLINRYNDYTEYVCKDQYENIYIFKEKSIMDYTVILDTYTLPQEKFNVEYASANNQKKVMLNIDKFFQMINLKDYTSAYNCLADSFKNNYFKTEESFKQYMKANVYDYNTVSYENFNDEISGIYQYKVRLTDKTNNSNSKEFNIIMKLTDGNDFEMSFEV